MKLEGKIAIVTGAASGLGEACARRFAQEGAKVVIADMNEEKGRKVASGLEGAHFIRVDVADPASVEAMVDETVRRFGRVDILMNNAGIDGDQAPIGDSSIDNWRRVMAINMDGVYYGMKYGLRQMAKQKSGVILNMSSLVGLVGMPGLPPYTASKAAVIHLAKEAAVEYGPYHIRVNALCPSVVRTPLVEHFINSSPDPKETRARFENMHPLPGMISIESVTAAALFLVSDDAAHITGVALPVDGGFSAGRLHR